MIKKLHPSKKHLANENDFITDKQSWSDENGSISLFKCDFNDSNFTQKLFSELDIYFPPELKNSVTKRQAEFLAGRFSAKQAILNSGFLNGTIPPVLVGINRCPVWPKGISGSITHNNSKAVCAVVKDEKNVHIGIDIEDHIPLDLALKIEESIHIASEKKILTIQEISENLATTLIFSAKESLFKALYPKIKSYFGFESVKVQSADLNKGVLTLRLTESLANQHELPSIYTCYFTLNKNNVFTAVY